MRILLAVDTRNDPRMAAAYVAERFGSAPLEVDVLTVTADEARGGGHGQDATRDAAVVAAEVAERVREIGAVTHVATHVERGRDATAVIAAAAARLASDIVLVETAPRGLFARLRAASVSHGLLRRAPCAVELLKPYTAAPRSLFNVLVLIAGERLADYPLHRLAAWPWPAGTHLRLLAAMPPATSELPVEANVFRVFDSVAAGRAAASRAGAALRAMAEDLAAALDGRVEVDHGVLETRSSAAVLREAEERYRASLIVTCAAALAGAPHAAGSAARGSAQGLALRIATGARCPVLVMREDAAPARRRLGRVKTFAPALVRA